MDRPNKILLVDDEPANLDVLIEALDQHYNTVVAVNGERALKLAAQAPQPDLILLDVVMPGMDGYEVCRLLKSEPGTADIPVIFVTGRNASSDEQKGLDLGAVDYIAKPVSPAIVQARVRAHLALREHNRELENRVRERTRELALSRLMLVQVLGRAAEFKDRQSAQHILNVCHYARMLGLAATGDADWADSLFHAAALHDLGKVGVPDRILTKPGPLDEEERALMQGHAACGGEILADYGVELLQLAREVALSHHEKWDGSGYPGGLAGRDIPLAGRIVAIADVFDALTQDRPYREAWSEDQAFAHLAEHAGRYFDPDLVAIFLARREEIAAIHKTHDGAGA